MGPLSDIRVVSLEQYAAGPYGTLHLADLGADVIKIEQPVGGDVGRTVPPRRADDDSHFFQAFNRNKRSVAIDVQASEGRTVLQELVAVSDAVYSNLRGDVPAKMGITYGQLKHVNPKVVCCNLSGYGMTGPRAAQPGFDYMVQGLAGWMSLTGEPDSPPQKSGLSMVDFSGGLVAAMSLMVGVHAARRDGVGGDCDVSLFDTAISMLNYLATWNLSFGFEPSKILRSGHQTLVPFGNFTTADGWIVAGGSKEKFWVRLCDALGLSHLAGDPRFASFDVRRDRRVELTTALDAVFVTRTTAEWLPILEAHGVPCAPVNTVAQALNDPQAVARDLVFEYEHPTLGAVGQVRSPVRFAEAAAAGEPARRAPALGTDTAQVLSELLGYSPGHIAELERTGVVRTEPERR